MKKKKKKRSVRMSNPSYFRSCNLEFNDVQNTSSASQAPNKATHHCIIALTNHPSDMTSEDDEDSKNELFKTMEKVLFKPK